MPSLLGRTLDVLAIENVGGPLETAFKNQRLVTFYATTSMLGFILVDCMQPILAMDSSWPRLPCTPPVLTAETKKKNFFVTRPTQTQFP